MPPVPADALLPGGATALEAPSESDRPATVCHFKGPEVPAAATAVRGLAHAPFPDSGVKLYFNGDPDSPRVHYARRVAYACITPPCRAGDPGPFIRLVFRTLALDLPQNFELLPPAPGCRGVPVLFRTPRDREAAARRQPFRLDGATVRLVPVRTVLDVSGGCMAHVALHGYPVEQRTGAHATDNCRRFGVVREIDPACVAAPDLSAVRVVLQLEHPREIPASSGSTTATAPPASSPWRSSGSGRARTLTTTMESTCLSSNNQLRPHIVT
ncbi:hypothetical protein VPH35_093183 [Triticum aestivum]